MKATRPASVIVAIPVKDEADRLVSCLAALEGQRGSPFPEIVLLLNNCSDGSADVAKEFAERSRLIVHVESRILPPDQASAGVARSLAMALAERRVAPDGVLLTTDADSVAPPDWIANNLEALTAADCVAGRAVIDPAEAMLIPERLHADDARECAFAALLDEVAALLDPDPSDPWPRHDDHSGASIAVRIAAYRAAGGMPAIPLGEDRAFFKALRRIDARVRHAPEAWVTVSGRIEGRARGGMADTIRRRMDVPDTWLDGRLERTAHAGRRARLRRQARGIWAGARETAIARQLQVSREAVQSAMTEPYFGLAWERLEDLSPVLRRQPVPLSALARETALARRLRDRLRGGSVEATSSDLDEELPGTVE